MQCRGTLAGPASPDDVLSSAIKDVSIYYILPLDFSSSLSDLARCGSMTPPAETLKLLDHLRVSPPLGSVPQTTLPITYFDAIWLGFPPVQRLFFYKYTSSTQHFQLNHLPNLKHCLSLALQIYYPLAGNLTFSPEYGDYFITYADGDSVALSLAESNADFNHVVADYPKDVKELHPFVPPLPSSDGEAKKPLLALQVTVFPSSGICVGITVHHAAGDGSSSMRFIKAWASIFKSGGDVSVVKDRPVFDRSLVGDLEELKRNLLEEIKLIPIDGAGKLAMPWVRSTFVLSGAQIDELRSRVASRSGTSEMGANNNKPSTFVLTCGYVWTCLAKARAVEGKTLYFAFAVDCRSRLSPPVPDTYFGNCIGGGMLREQVSMTELTGEEGLMAASKTIQETVRRLGEEGPLNEARTWFPRYVALSEKGDILSVAGSNRLGVYKTDFGWGRPCKVEIISIETGGSMSLAENRDEGSGGVEIGMVGPPNEIERFTRAFEEGLEKRCG